MRLLATANMTASTTAFAPLGDNNAVAVIIDRNRHVVVATPGAIRTDPWLSRATARSSPRPASSPARARYQSSPARCAGRGAVARPVASPLNDIDETVAELTVALVVAIPRLTLLAVVLYLLVGRTLRPVERSAPRSQRSTPAARGGGYHSRFDGDRSTVWPRR